MGVPVNSLASPRFCGVRTFQRLPHSADCSGNDFAVLGVPFDTATSYRPGCRFGPAAIRDASSILKSYDGTTRAVVTEFMRRLPYRLLATATAAPKTGCWLSASTMVPRTVWVRPWASARPLNRRSTKRTKEKMARVDMDVVLCIQDSHTLKYPHA